MKGKLYVISTPIGNIEDITYRALNQLKNTKNICCEDIREGINLLKNYFDTSQHHFFDAYEEGMKKAFALLQAGEDVCLISDRGTPCLSDPGNELVRACHKYKIDTIPFPGACAITALMSVAGLGSRFMFYGFIPKNGMSKILEELGVFLEQYPVVFFESAVRIKKTLQPLVDSGFYIVIGRELTKKFETLYYGALTNELLDTLSIKGEYVFALTRNHFTS